MLLNEVAAVDIVKLAEAHIQLMSFILFRKSLQAIKCPKVREHLGNLCALHGLTNLAKDCRRCFEKGYFQGGTAYSVMLLEAIKMVNLKIRP